MESITSPFTNLTLVLIYLAFGGLLAIITIFYFKRNKSQRPIFVTLLIGLLWLAYLYLLGVEFL